MQPGDLVRINSLWHVLDRGPGLPADLLPGMIGTLIEQDMSGLLSWGWKILVGDQLFSHVNECYMETIDEAG
jgi:hypothetical protein